MDLSEYSASMNLESRPAGNISSASLKKKFILDSAVIYQE